VRGQSQEEKEIRKQAKLLRVWQAWHRDQRKTVLAGPHAHMAERLLYIADNIGPGPSPSILLAFVKGVDWTGIDEATRRALLHEIGNGIIKLRVKSGLEPFDDDLGERPSVFHAIREILFPAQAAPTGAEPGFNIQQHNVSRIGKCLVT
jgi:hypothetical protein